MKQNPYVPTLRASTVTQQPKTRLTSQRQRRTVKKCLRLLKCWGNGERTWQTKLKESNKKKMRGNRNISVVLRQKTIETPPHSWTIKASLCCSLLECTHSVNEGFIVFSIRVSQICVNTQLRECQRSKRLRTCCKPCLVETSASRVKYAV